MDDQYETDEDLVGRYAEAHEIYGNEWLNDAACAELPLEDFYAPRRPKLETLLACRSCPVRSTCLDVISYVETNTNGKQPGKGLFGGLTQHERARFYKYPKAEWKDRQDEAIDGYIRETFAAQDLSEELRSALFGNEE